MKNGPSNLNTDYNELLRLFLPPLVENMAREQQLKVNDIQIDVTVLILPKELVVIYIYLLK